MSSSKPVRLTAKIFICLLGMGIGLYATIRAQNNVTKLRRQIPPLARGLKALQEDNQRLQYEIDRFENPVHLMELVRQAEYSHLKYPYKRDVVYLSPPQASETTAP